MLYAHSKLVTLVGLSDAQVAAACRGETPVGVSVEEEAAYEFARAVTGSWGPVEEEVWEDARGKGGERCSHGATAGDGRVCVYVFGGKRRRRAGSGGGVGVWV